MMALVMFSRSSSGIRWYSRTFNDSGTIVRPLHVHETAESGIHMTSICPHDMILSILTKCCGHGPTHLGEASTHLHTYPPGLNAKSLMLSRRATFVQSQGSTTTRSEILVNTNPIMNPMEFALHILDTECSIIICELT